MGLVLLLQEGKDEYPIYDDWKYKKILRSIQFIVTYCDVFEIMVMMCIQLALMRGKWKKMRIISMKTEFICYMSEPEILKKHRI